MLRMLHTSAYFVRWWKQRNTRGHACGLCPRHHLFSIVTVDVASLTSSIFVSEHAICMTMHAHTHTQVITHTHCHTHTHIYIYIYTRVYIYIYTPSALVVPLRWSIYVAVHPTRLCRSAAVNHKSHLSCAVLCLQDQAASNRRLLLKLNGEVLFMAPVGDLRTVHVEQAERKHWGLACRKTVIRKASPDVFFNIVWSFSAQRWFRPKKTFKHARSLPTQCNHATQAIFIFCYFSTAAAGDAAGARIAERDAEPGFDEPFSDARGGHQAASASEQSKCHCRNCSKTTTQTTQTTQTATFTFTTAHQSQSDRVADVSTVCCFMGLRKERVFCLVHDLLEEKLLQQTNMIWGLLLPKIAIFWISILIIN